MSDYDPQPRRRRIAPLCFSRVNDPARLTQIVIFILILLLVLTVPCAVVAGVKGGRALEVCEAALVPFSTW